MVRSYLQHRLGIMDLMLRKFMLGLSPKERLDMLIGDSPVPGMPAAPGGPLVPAVLGVAPIPVAVAPLALAPVVPESSTFLANGHKNNGRSTKKKLHANRKRVLGAIRRLINT